MPIVKKDEAMPLPPITLLLYGQAGCGKTSAACTSENALLIDCERGSHRSVSRCDTLIANSWQDIACEYTHMSGYKTIIIDTAKSVLDDYLKAYAIKKDSKMATNSLKRFGVMADDFKDFTSTLRKFGCNLIFICHDKETADGDIIKHAPDCTGQSKQELLRMADQVGYVSMVNNKRYITFEPTDNFVGKNVARLSPMEIPDASTKEFPTFMDDIIATIQKVIQSRNEAQQKAANTFKELNALFEQSATEEDVAHLVEKAKELPQLLKRPYFEDLKVKLLAKGFEYKDNKFVKKDEQPEEASH